MLLALKSGNFGGPDFFERCASVDAVSADWPRPTRRPAASGDGEARDIMHQRFDQRRLDAVSLGRLGQQGRLGLGAKQHRLL